jgi:hypothetical protein
MWSIEGGDMKRARGRLLGVVAGLAALAAIVSPTAWGTPPVTVQVGNLIARVNGHTSPKALPKSRFAPVGFHGSASLATKDGSHIPAALGTQLLVDRHIRLDTEGLKTCRLGEIEARTPAQAKEACGGALLGTGTSSAQVQFAESQPFEAKGPLLAFNGPPEGGYGGYNEQFYYVYASVPVPTALIAIGKVSKAAGKYGYKISISIPTIAGGAGSFNGADFTIDRKWVFEGVKHSFLNAECADGHFDAQVEIVFAGSSALKGKVVNACRSLTP